MSATCPSGSNNVELCKAECISSFLSLVQIVSTAAKLKKFDTPKPTIWTDYDFIVVGGGAGGSAVAARLAENIGWKILLLEAGPEEPEGALIPQLVSQYLGNPTYDWQYETTETNACLGTNKKCKWPRGKNLGGTTAHNGMMYNRGHPEDYKSWNITGWSSDEVLPFFKYSENNENLEVSEFHNKTGPLNVALFPFQPSNVELLLQAAKEKNLGTSDDLNGKTFKGFSTAQVTQTQGTRVSAATAFLRPLRDRPNLHVLLNAQVTGLTFESNSIVKGVKYNYEGKAKEVNAKREVILSAGAIGSPHILLLSGIGPKDHLESKGITVARALPGVGNNVFDHVSYRISYNIERNTNILFESVKPDYEKEKRGGLLASTGLSQFTGIASSKKATDSHPDLQFYFYGDKVVCENQSETPNEGTITVAAVNLHPKSRGKIELENRNPLTKPKIKNVYLTDESDIDVIIDGINLIKDNLMTANALASIQPQLIKPLTYPCTSPFGTEDYWKCEIKQNTHPENHQGGSCKMGNDASAVVDNELKVIGFENLRVADASVMPKPVSGNTAAVAVMIGERCADFIRLFYSNNYPGIQSYNKATAKAQ